MLADTAGLEWCLGRGIGHRICTYLNFVCTICTRIPVLEWLGQSSAAGLLLGDHVSYQNRTLGEHAYSYSYFNWRTNYDVVFTDHSFSRNSFDTETCITSALRWVIWIVFSFKRPILNPFRYPLDLLAQAEDCVSLRGCVTLNLSYRTRLTKNLGH